MSTVKFKKSDLGVVGRVCLFVLPLLGLSKVIIEDEVIIGSRLEFLVIWRYCFQIIAFNVLNSASIKLYIIHGHQTSQNTFDISSVHHISWISFLTLGLKVIVKFNACDNKIDSVASNCMIHIYFANCSCLIISRV